MDLFALGRSLEGLDPLTIHSERCLHQVSPLATCQKCQDICPQRALFYSQGDWQLAEDRCTHCGLCVTVCPSQVFLLEEHFLLQQGAHQAHLQICCYQMALPQADIFKINCLQQLYPELIFQLLDKVDHLSIYLDENQCQNCVNSWFTPGLKLQLERFALPLEKLSISKGTDSSAEARNIPSSADTSRRSFFGDCLAKVRTSSQKVLAQSMDQLLAFGSDNEAAPAQPQLALTSHRQGLLACYSRAKPAVDFAYTLPYRRLKIDHCTFCGACTRLCPTGALSLWEEGDLKKIAYQPSLCLQCCLCLDLCLRKAIYWSDNLTIAQLMAPLPMDLVRATKSICPECGQDFWDSHSQATTCHFCG